MIPAGSRAHEPVVNTEVGEELHYCAYCDSRTFLDEATHYACGARNHDCPHCGQRYSITDEEDDMEKLEPTDNPTAHANGDALFEEKITPLLQALFDGCYEHGFPVLTAVAFVNEKNETIVHANVQGNPEGGAPFAFYHAMQVMGAGARPEAAGQEAVAAPQEPA